MPLRRAITVGLLALPVTAGGGIADARSTHAAFALRPAGEVPYFFFKARPGAVYTDRVQVANLGRRAGTVRLYAVDATTGATSGAAYRDRTHPRNDVGAWTRLRRTRLRLEPGERRTVAFRVTVPRRAASGDHLGGIVADGGVVPAGSTTRKRARFRLAVRPLTVIAVQPRLPGRLRPAMTLDALTVGGTPGRQQLVIRMTNTGNALFKGSGTVVVRDRDGARRKRVRFPLDTFVPRSHIDLPVFVPGRPLPVGRYAATVTTRFKGRAVRRTFGFEVVEKDLRQVFGSPPRASSGIGAASGAPAALIAGGIASAMLAGFGCAWLLFRRREKRRAHRERRREAAIIRA